MHDPFNTRGGQFGFKVEMADGRVFHEGDVTWDEVPRDAKVKSLSIAHLPTGHSYVILEHFGRYFFANRGSVGREAGISKHVSKVFGGCNVGIQERASVIELGFDGLLPQKIRADENVPVELLGFTASTFREGV